MVSSSVACAVLSEEKYINNLLDIKDKETTMVLGLDSSSSKWILVYFPVSWITQFGHGLVTTVVGPTQPYLARNTGVNIDTINLVWTFGFFGYMVGSLGTSFIFKRYLRRPAAKLCFLWLTIFLTGVRFKCVFSFWN